MTSVLIIVEMTSGYSLILPLMIANMTAYVLARHYRPTPIYEALLEQDGIHLRDRAVLDTLEELEIEQIVRPRDATFVSFSPASRARELLAATGAHLRQVAFPVLDADARLVGLLYAEDLADPARRSPSSSSWSMRPTSCARRRACATTRTCARPSSSCATRGCARCPSSTRAAG